MNRFPDNKKFAFTIFDDTDLSTVENVRPVYRLLEELGMRTTKSVWPLASVADARYGGSSLQDAAYLAFVRDLQERGFEIALHGVRNTHASRAEVKAGLAEFRRLLGRGPRVHANHSSNAENIYWGAARFSLLNPAYRITAALRGWHFDGHDQRSKHFWGDLCRQHIAYVRNFVFNEINLDRVNPSMPYHDEGRPYVNAWFSSSDAGDVRRFCSLLREKNQDRLEREGGVCILYTHFACGFVQGGHVDPQVAELLRRLASRNGWFAPVSTILDRLAAYRGSLHIRRSELYALECRWAKDRVVGALSRQFHRDLRMPPVCDAEVTRAAA